MLYVLTGSGKGKTTSALGMGLRAAGGGRKVLMVQFLKAGGSSETKVIKKIGNFDIKGFGRKGFLKKKTKSLPKKDVQLAEKAFNFAQRALEGGHDFLILDEINVALHLGLLQEKEVLDFLKKHRTKADIVLTGRYCPKAIIGLADLVTEMKEVKHYYKKGKRARKGIEY